MGIYKKPTVNIIPNDERLNASPQDWEKAKTSSLTTLIQYISGISSHCRRQGKEISHSDWKGRNKAVPICR